MSNILFALNLCFKVILIDFIVYISLLFLLNFIGLETLVKAFAAHLDGITGVICLSKQPILISWSQRNGSMKMWRLDTLELCHETKLSQSINSVHLPLDDRLFYLADTELQIFSVNILYSIFTILSSPIDTLKLCNIRRIRPDGDVRPISITNNSVLDASSQASTDEPISDAQIRKDSRWTKILNKLDILANPTESFFKSLKNSVKTDTTYLDERVISVLDDNSIVGVSPLSGLVLNILFPPVETDSKYHSVDIELKGERCFGSLTNGKFMDYHTTVNPGRVLTTIIPKKEGLQVMFK